MRVKMYSKLEKYIKSIRNPDKKEYAKRVAYEFLHPESDKAIRVENLSYMAHQAVRMRIQDIVEGKS